MPREYNATYRQSPECRIAFRIFVISPGEPTLVPFRRSTVYVCVCVYAVNQRTVFSAIGPLYAAGRTDGRTDTLASFESREQRKKCVGRGGKGEKKLWRQRQKSRRAVFQRPNNSPPRSAANSRMIAKKLPSAAARKQNGDPVYSVSLRLKAEDSVSTSVFSPSPPSSF